MPSQLVDDVRRLIREREEAGRPVTALERTFIEAALVPRRNTPDLVDELEAAVKGARNVLLGTPPKGLSYAEVTTARQRATTRLLAACRAVLDHDPAREPLDPTAILDTLTDADKRTRADVDG